MIRFQSPAQLKAVGKTLERLPYDGKTGVAQNRRGAVIISNSRELHTVMSNGDVQIEKG